MREIGIVLIDDQPIVLYGLTQLFGGEPDFVVLAAGTRGDEALQAAEIHQPEVMLLDASLPDRDSAGLLHEIGRASPVTRTIIFAARLASEGLVEALRAGASAILFKDAPAAELVGFVRQVAAAAGSLAPGDGLDPDALAVDRYAGLLSPREREIAEWVSRGARNKEIAWELGLAEGTVKLHISRAFKKLGVGNRVGLSRLLAGR